MPIAVKWMKVADLIPYPANAKTHPEEQIAKLSGLLLSHGWDVPIVVDKHHVIIKGHGRRLAALKLNEQGSLADVAGTKDGMLPVIVRDDLTDAQVKAARLADNRIAETEWDAGFLRLELEQLNELGISGLELGFGQFELDVLFDDIHHDSDTDTSDGKNEDYRDKKEILVTVTKYEHGMEAMDAIKALCSDNPHWAASVTSHGAAE